MPKLLLVLVGVALPIGLIELGMRCHHFNVKSRSLYKHAENPTLQFVRKPRAGKEINSFGFRDREYSLQKPEGVSRVLILGDSVTNGYGLEFEERYSNKLEILLTHYSEEYQVLNLGTNQYATTQEVELLKLVGLEMEPNLVILSYVLNDPTPDGSINGFFERDRAMSLALDWVTRRWKNVTGSKEPFQKLDDCEYFDYYSHMHCDAIKWAGVQQAFRGLRDLSQQYGFQVLVVVFPLLENGEGATFDDYKWSSIHRRVAEEATLNGFDSLDLLPFFSQQKLADLKLNPTDCLHPNARGNEIAADAIFQKLQELRFVDPPD